MEEIKVIGIDLAKSVFEICTTAEDGRAVERRRLKRRSFAAYMEKAPRVLVGLEAGPGAHDWARRLSSEGFVVKMMSPRAVRAYRSGPHKSDALDAAAVAEAATRASVRPVAVKSERAQTQQALVRVRDRQVSTRTKVLNQLRSLLLEFGIVGPRNLLTGYRRLVETGELAALPERTRRLFDELWQEARELNDRVRAFDRELARDARADPEARRLGATPGVGPIVVTQVIAQIVEPGDFRNARAMPAYLGIVPKLIASGKTSRLGPITKHGPSEIRKNLVLGAHAVITAAQRYPGKDDPIYVFARRLIAKGKPRNLVAVAVANKIARILCAMLRTGQPYNPNHKPA